MWQRMGGCAMGRKLTEISHYLHREGLTWSHYLRILHSILSVLCSEDHLDLVFPYHNEI